MAYEWAETGELSPEAIALLEPVLSPLVGDQGESDDNDDDD